VRSTARLDYAQVQAALDDGSAGEVLQLLAEVGGCASSAPPSRGRVDLPTPSQEVEVDAGGRPSLPGARSCRSRAGTPTSAC
jgi:exoribonuclease R